MPTQFASVQLEHAYRLINHGPVILVSARHEGREDVMAAAWACVLSFVPPRLTVVLHKPAATRQLVEGSGRFVIQVPTVQQVALIRAVGERSQADHPDKLRRAGVELFDIDESGWPLVSGCAGWLACRVVPSPDNQQNHDLFIGQVEAAWSDTRVFRDGLWQFEQAGPQWRTVHHVTDEYFYAIGDRVPSDSPKDPGAKS